MKSALPERRLIPKWRPVGRSLASQEVVPIKPQKIVNVEANLSDFQHAIREWKDNPTAGHLGDVISFSVFPECEEGVHSAVKEAVNRGLEVTTVQKRLAGIQKESIADARVIYGAKENPHGQRIRDLRSLLRVNPANPLVLLDYAQLQLALGKKEVAEKSLKVALELMPNNALALRTYARFLVHIDRPDHAHSLIARHPSTRSNPWLVASELALADTAGRAPQYFGVAKKILSDGGISPGHLTEMAGAMSFHQMKAGRHKLARKYFSAATVDPNDNVAAQAVNDQLEMKISLDGKNIQNAIRNTNEASALAAVYRGDDVSAEHSGRAWLYEEPFSSRPVIFLAGVYTYSEEYNKALNIIDCGLRTDPKDLNLLINSAYLNGVLGNIEECFSACRKSLNVDNQAALPFVESTLGLLKIRDQDFDGGDFLYKSAMDRFDLARQYVLKALCASFHAKSAQDTGHPHAAALLAEALDLVRKHPSAEAVRVISRMTQAENIDSQADNLRRAEQFIYHPARNILEKTNRITARGAPLIIWADKQ